MIAEKDSSELFTLDLAGDKGIVTKHLKGKKPLKSDEIINQRSAIAAISMRKRPGDKITDGIADEKRQRISYISHKELARLRQIADGRTTQTVEVREALHDPWDEPKEATLQSMGPKYSFLDKPTVAKPPKTLKHKPVSLLANGKTVPAIIKPLGGYSYNPMATDYQERFVSEHDREAAAEQKRLEAVEAERVKAEARAKSAAEAEAAEARGDLSEWEEDSAWEGFESGAEDTKLKAKRPERKSQVQRNKIKRRKEEERKAKMAADIRKKEEQAKEIKKIAKAVAAREAERSASLLAGEVDSESSEAEDDLELRRRQLGKIKLPERDLELVLPSELQESLRLLKPEGNVLKDRYRSLLVRGKMESRRKIAFHKQKKVKATEKWSSKDWMLH